MLSVLGHIERNGGWVNLVIEIGSAYGKHVGLFTACEENHSQFRRLAILLSNLPVPFMLQCVGPQTWRLCINPKHTQMPKVSTIFKSMQGLHL